MQRQSGGIEFFEGLNGTGVTQFECFIRAQVTGLNEACSQSQSSSGTYSSQCFHVQIP
jgi:hypothetical protein